ncbi:hypothetical protein J4433_03270 [Candidatus Pacearchaeota archaeon]|nr:hypothetical protein [Candidatus Pacearchaeota archaeon]
MLDKMLYDLAEGIVGKNGIAIIDILKDNRDVNEFKIAEKMKLTINQVRNILYRLDAHDIVSFIRKKDKRKGWYIYYWSLDKLKALKLFVKMKERGIQQLNHVLASHENKRFFRCNGCEIELTEENALTHDFICLECGNLLELSDNKGKIVEIRKNITKEKKILELIRAEMAKLSVEEHKKIGMKEKRARKQAKQKPKKKSKKAKGRKK